MLELKVWDIAGGERSQVVATNTSFQCTETTIRDPDGNTVLYLNEVTSMWVVYADGSEWLDWTVAASQWR